MSSLNKVMLIGNLGRDPEIRAMRDGQRVANLSLATSESWKDKASGERKERTEWHKVVVFNDGLAGVCEKYLRKGSKVYVEGALQTRKWTDQSGVDKYSTEVVLTSFSGVLRMLGEKGGDSQVVGGAAQGSGNAVRKGDSHYSGGGMSDRAAAQALDDEIPF